VVLLLAGPGLIATLTFAPIVIALFYTAKFEAAVPVLRWICLGTTLQVITWPMGFIIVAKAKQAIFFATELAWAWALVSLALTWICVNAFGLNGAGSHSLDPVFFMDFCSTRSFAGSVDFAGQWITSGLVSSFYF
jgi:antigen flippase